MSSNKALDFLHRHGMSPHQIEPEKDSAKMAEDMEWGLQGKHSSMPMIPTYLSDSGSIPKGIPVAVIDAGGTNFRSALVTFDDNGYRVDQLNKWKMPGIEKPATWEEFISFTADRIEPLMAETNYIGFCFSYSADIMPDIDGRVQRIDKEVVIRGCEGQLVGASLKAELERRGISGKQVVILNDTVAVLLGGLASVNVAKYSGFIGQVSGTGTNTCCSLPQCRITKLGLHGEKRMIVNLESGMYDGMPVGDFDRTLDNSSNNPGSKAFEKHTAGVYLGELCRQMLLAAAEENIFSAETVQKVHSLGWIDSAVIDAWACGEQLAQVSCGDEDGLFVQDLCKAMFERSARCMCTNLAAILLLTGDGKDPYKPVLICAEGSLVQKGRAYRPVLEALIRQEIGEKMGRYAELKIGEETTLPGSAAAALLNIH